MLSQLCLKQGGKSRGKQLTNGYKDLLVRNLHGFT